MKRCHMAHPPCVKPPVVRSEPPIRVSWSLDLGRRHVCQTPQQSGSELPLEKLGLYRRKTREEEYENTNTLANFSNLSTEIVAFSY